MRKDNAFAPHFPYFTDNFLSRPTKLFFGKNLVERGKRTNFVVDENLMLMRYPLSYLAAALAALTLAACGQDGDQASKVELALSQAEQCAARGDADQAYRYAISLTDTSEFDLLPSQLCRQALVLYRISNDGEDVERLVASLTCYERALSADLDSVDAYVSSLDPEDRAVMQFISDLNTRLNHPQDYSDYEVDEYIDSAAVQEH